MRYRVWAVFLCVIVALSACSHNQVVPRSGSFNNSVSPLTAAQAVTTGIDSGHFAYVGTSTGVFVIDLGTFAQKAFIPAPKPPTTVIVTGVAVSPAHTRVYYSDGNQIDVIDTRLNKIAATVQVPHATFSVFNPVVSQAYAIGDNYFYVINASTNRVITKFRENLPGHFLGRPAVAPNGSQVWNVNEGGINVYNVKTRLSSQIVDPGVADHPDLNITFSKDSTKAYVEAFNEGTEIYSVATHKVIGHLSLAIYEPMALDPTGHYLYADGPLGHDGTLKFDLQTNQLVQTFPVAGNFGISVAPSGNVYETAAYFYGGSGLIQLDPSTGQFQRISYGRNECPNETALCDAFSYGNFIM